MVSDVIANAKAGNLLVTVQIHNNVIAAANLVDICRDRRDPGEAADRRRGEDGGEGGDPDLLDGSEPLAGGDEALRGGDPLGPRGPIGPEAGDAPDRVIELLGCEAIDEETVCPSLEIDACFAADLMSDVLAFCGPGALLMTGLASIQSVHTADVADLSAILFVNGKRPPQTVVELARERGIPLLTTTLSMFEACGILYWQGLLPSSKE